MLLFSPHVTQNLHDVDDDDVDDDDVGDDVDDDDVGDDVGDDVDVDGDDDGGDDVMYSTLIADFRYVTLMIIDGLVDCLVVCQEHCCT